MILLYFCKQLAFYVAVQGLAGEFAVEKEGSDLPRAYIQHEFLSLRVGNP